MAATKLGQVTLPLKVLTFLNDPKNKSCSAGQNTYSYQMLRQSVKFSESYGPCKNV